jgi:predicted RNase H-like HicB family nuclease
MNEKLLEKAKSLAKRGYITEIYIDKTTDGNDIFLSKCPELLGCMAQGKTIKEAMDNIENSRVDYIYFLLEDNLPVPEPSAKQTEPVEGSTMNITVDIFSETSDFKTSSPKTLEGVLEKVIEPSNRELLFSTSLRT